MLSLRQVRRIGAAALLLSIPLLHASAQTAPSTSPTPTPPGASPPATEPMPPRASDKPMPRPSDRSVTAPAKVNPLIGLAVFSADGSKLGSVHSVSSGPDGKATAIHIKTGGFLGFGAKLVAIPEAKFTKSGNNIQLGMTADEVSKLPEIKEQS